MRAYLVNMELVNVETNEKVWIGEEKIREVAERLRKVGVRLVFSGLKHQVYRIFEKANLVEELGSDVFYSDKESALRALQNETVECERGQAAAKAATV